MSYVNCLFSFFFSSRRRHTRCALVTGVQTCALPIYHHAAAVAEGGLDRARLGVMLAAVLVDVRNEESRFLHPLHDQFARAVPAIALEAVEAQIFRREIGRAHV